MECLVSILYKSLKRFYKLFAVKYENKTPNVTKKNDNCLSLDYLPSPFNHTTLPVKRRLGTKLHRLEGTQAMKKRLTEERRRSDAVDALIRLSCTITTEKTNLTSAGPKVGTSKNVHYQPNTKSNVCTGTES